MLNEKETWLTEVLGLVNGIPSYTTFWTFFVLLNLLSLENCFVQWVQSKFDFSAGDTVSIDGKAHRGTTKKRLPNSFVYIVSAWVTSQNLTLGQLKVEGKSNEITAIPKLLDLLDVEGTTLTIDAMGCQTEIASKIIEKKQIMFLH